MKNKIGSIIICLITLLYIGLSSYTTILIDLGIQNSVRLFTVIIIDIYLLIVIFESASNVFGKDKLFDMIVNNNDTVYLIMNRNINKVIYISDNVESILGVTSKNPEMEVFKILTKSEIKNEMNNWDGKSVYVSPMIEYNNPKYNINSWLRIKISIIILNIIYYIKMKSK